jgi:hypothetical protein
MLIKWIHAFAQAYYSLEIAAHSDMRYFRFLTVLMMYAITGLFPSLDIATLAAMSGFLGYYSDAPEKRAISACIDLVCIVLAMIKTDSVQPIAWTYLGSATITGLTLALYEGLALHGVLRVP